MLYDSVLTVEDEIELVWRRNTSPSMWLFLANRATLILGIAAFAATSASVEVGAPRVTHLAILMTLFRRELSCAGSGGAAASDHRL